MQLPFSLVSMFLYSIGKLDRFPDIAVTCTLQSVPADNPVTFTFGSVTESGKIGVHEQQVEQLHVTFKLYLSTCPVGGIHCTPNSFSALKKVTFSDCVG